MSNEKTDDYRVQTMGNGTYRIWNVTKGKWANRSIYDTHEEANKAARALKNG